MYLHSWCHVPAGRHAEIFAGLANYSDRLCMQGRDFVVSEDSWPVPSVATRVSLAKERGTRSVLTGVLAHACERGADACKNRREAFWSRTRLAAGGLFTGAVVLLSSFPIHDPTHLDPHLLAFALWYETHLLLLALCVGMILGLKLCFLIVKKFFAFGFKSPPFSSRRSRQKFAGCG